MLSKNSPEFVLPPAKSYILLFNVLKFLVPRLAGMIYARRAIAALSAVYGVTNHSILHGVANHTLRGQLEC